MKLSYKQTNYNNCAKMKDRTSNCPTIFTTPAFRDEPGLPPPGGIFEIEFESRLTARPVSL